MNFEFSQDMLATLVVSVIFFIGVVGSLLPVVPGCVIVWSGFLVYKIWMPELISWSTLLIAGGITIMAILLDSLCTYFGAKKFGASWKGGVGALIGALLGPFLLAPLVTPIGGLILGPVLGAVLGELSAGRSWRDSGKAGLGTILGNIAAFFLKFVIALILVGYFFIATKSA